MRILVLGARGFIGRHVVAALQAQRHDVVGGVSAQADATQVVVDFGRDTQPAIWLARLRGIDAVVNAVGVLRDTRARPMQAVHADTPRALFEACTQAGVRKLVHISALGIADSDSPYAATKRAAEQALLSQREAGVLAATLVRPSVVFGPGGDSSALFTNLARLPVAILPAVAWRVRIQPVHVQDLAASVAGLVMQPQSSAPAVLEAVGPEPLSLAEFIASLRQQQGHGPARLLALPDGLTRLSAQLGDWLPVTPWGTQALGLLSHDSVGDSGPITTLLGRAPVHYSQLLKGAQVP